MRLIAVATLSAVLLAFAAAGASAAPQINLSSAGALVYAGDPTREIVEVSFGSDMLGPYVTFESSVAFGGSEPGAQCFVVTPTKLLCNRTPSVTGVVVNLDGGADDLTLAVNNEGPPAGLPPAGFALAADGAGGDDTITLGRGTAVLGGPGNDRITGSAEADVVSGGDDNDILKGRDGADTLSGDAGDDQLDGGDDQLVSPDDRAADGLSGGTGVDRVSYSAQTTSVDVTQDGVANDGVAGEGDNVSGDVELVIGGSAPDRLVGDGGPDELRGEGGDDTLIGAGGADVLIGGFGNDRLEGGDDGDSLTGGDGNDTLDGGAGPDSFVGDSPIGVGNDTILARDGTAESIDCGPGTDTATIDAADTVPADAFSRCETVDRPAVVTPSAPEGLLRNGGPGPDRLTGGPLADRLRGLGGADLLRGLAGADLLRGGRGNDVLAGGAGDDALFGDAGDDRLTGGPGLDRMNGGPGADTIQARDGRAETVRCGPGRDRVRADPRDRLIGCEVVARR